MENDAFLVELVSSLVLLPLIFLYKQKKIKDIDRLIIGKAAFVCHAHFPRFG